MTIVTTATLLSACNKNNETVDNRSGEIYLSSGVIAQQTRAGNSSDVPDKQIANGQQVKVIVEQQDADVSTQNYGYDEALTAQGDGTFTGTPMYYPESGQGVNIYAYHPAAATATFAVKTDQSKSTGTDYFDSDLLYSDAKDYPRQNTAHSLTFKHKLCKLTFTLKSGDGSPSINNVKVQWLNVCNTITFEAATGAVSIPTNAGGITPHPTYGAIIVPQTVKANTQLLKVTLSNGGVLYYTPQADQTFEGGKKYNYQITVNLTGLTATSTITDWEPVSDINGEAVM